VNRLLNQHRFDVILSVSILCLAGVWFNNKRASPHLADGATNADERNETLPSALTVHVPATTISYHGEGLDHLPWQGSSASIPLRRKQAVRLVELNDAFLISMATCNLDTNSVEVTLNGSLLTISARSGPGAGLPSRSSFMLPVNVDAKATPEVWLDDGTLQIRIAKPCLVAMPAATAMKRF